jgi:transposase
MGEYSERTKLAAAEDYCRGTLGLRQVALRHRVTVASLRNWAAAFRVLGAAGVLSRPRRFHSAEFKLAVLNRMASEKLSRRQVAALFGIRNRDMIGLWQRAYEIGGVAALHTHSSIRRNVMPEKTRPDSQGGGGTDENRSRHELLEELQQLRAENAYLKKLKALAQADQKPAHDKGSKPCQS